MRFSVLLVILSLLALPALAVEDASPVPSCANATPAAVEEQLSEEDWSELGFRVTDKVLMAGSDSDACPVITSCTEFSLCRDSDACNTVDTGNPCCVTGKWELCCIVGTIHVTRCECTAECDPFCDPCPPNVVRGFDCR